MSAYQYKVVPAPSRGLKGKGVKGADGKFAFALEKLMNDMGAAGWEFQRAETLPSEERAGLTSKTTVFRNVLVFRRTRDADVSAFEPVLLDAPDTTQDVEDDQTDATHEATPEPDDSEITEDQTDDLSGPARARAEQMAHSND